MNVCSCSGDLSTWGRSKRSSSREKEFQCSRYPRRDESQLLRVFTEDHRCVKSTKHGFETVGTTSCRIDFSASPEDNSLENNYGIALKCLPVIKMKAKNRYRSLAMEMALMPIIAKKLG